MAVKDIKVYAGDTEGWVSIGDVSHLPISSTDGTVVLDSPSADTFTISTGGTEQVKVDPNGRFLVGQNAGANPNFDAHFYKNGWNQFVVESASSNAQIKIIANTFMFTDTVDPIAGVWRKTYYNSDTAASTNALTVDPSGNLTVAGQVQTNTITSRDAAANDAAIELGANATISTGGAERLEVKNGTHPYGVLQTATGGSSNSVSYFQSNECKGAKASHTGIQINTSSAGGGNTIGNGFGVACNPPDNTNAITGAWKSFSVSIPDNPATTSYGYYANAGNFQADHWAFYAEEQLQSYFGGGMFTPKITGSTAPNSDASIELGANATISTGGAERVTVQADGKVGMCSTAKGMGSLSGGLKVGTDASIGLQNVVYGKNANSYGFFVGVNLDMESATQFVAYQSQQPQNYAGADASLTKYIDFNSTDATAFVKEQYGFYSNVASRNDTDGSPLVRYQFYASTTAPSYFGGDVQTSRLTGIAANDASIELGANFTATAGSAFFEMRAGGNCGIGTSGETLKAKFDVKGTIAAKPTATIDKVGSGIPTIINRSMTDGGVYSGITFFQDVDAVGISIASRSKLIISEDDIRAVDSYTPTQPNSIATKQYVDDSIDQAIQGNQGDTSIEIGTPTSATQPDDAPGSMKVDENFLWVKTNTAWKKLSLAAFDDNATSVTVQLTQAAFNAIASPDPNILYVIVGD